MRIEDFDKTLTEIEQGLIRLNALYLLGAIAHQDSKEAADFDAAVTQLLLSASVLIAQRRNTNQRIRQFMEVANDAQ